MTKICDLSGCERGHYAHGMCEMHYQRAKRGQSLTEKSRYEKSDKERFDEKWEMDENGCWIWNSRQLNGAAERANTFHLAGRPTRASVASYRLRVGDTGKHWVLHACDNQMCVNPDHLYLGTPAQNSAGMHERGRANGPKGNSHPFAKLTHEKVAEIRRKHAAGGISQRALAREYGVNQSSLRDIIIGKTWAAPSQ